MAYDFVRASSQYLSIVGVPVSSTPLTMACWFQTDDLTNVQYIVGLSDNSSTASFDGWFLRTEPVADAIQATVFSAGSAVSAQTTGSAISSGTWYHACGVFASSTSRTVYLNGGNSASSSLNGVPSDSVTNTFVGINRTSGTAFLDGKVAEFGIWDTDLTSGEVALLADGFPPSMVRRDNLVLYAPLVREAIDVTRAVSFSNNNLATVTAHSRTYRPHRRMISGKVIPGSSGTATLAGAFHTGQQTSPSVVFNVPL